MSGQIAQAVAVSWAPLITVSGAFFIAGLGFFFRATSKLTEVITILKIIQHELGDHENGIRGRVHKMTEDMIRFDVRLTMLEERKKHEN